MFPASSKGGGQCAAFPDVCKVPAPGPPGFVPTPFPNVARVASASDTSGKVRIVNKESVTISSSIPRSSGDEAGTLKGMVSMVNMGKTVFKVSSSKVKVEGSGVVFLSATTSQNKDNLPGAQAAPSQAKVIVAP